MKKNEKGITLIALIITIIVLLILAGVSIAMLTGQNGILSKAGESKIENAHGEVRERLQLEAQAYYLKKVKATYTGDLLSYLKRDENRLIDDNGKVDVLKLTQGNKLVTGNGKGETDIYKVEEKKEETGNATKLASLELVKIAETTETSESSVKKYSINYYDSRGKVKEIGILTDDENLIGVEGEDSGSDDESDDENTGTPIDPNQPPLDTNKKIVGLKNEAGIEEWTPYYDDGNNKYIISWDIIPKTSVSDEIQSKKNSSGTEVEWDPENPTGNGQEVVTSNFWRRYLYKTPLTNANSIWCEKLLNESYWTKFYDTSYGEAAIGSPTLEMFEKAYNARYGTEEKVGSKWYFWAGEGNGYSVGMINGGTLTHTEDKSFFINSEYILASPANGRENGYYSEFISVSSRGTPGQGIRGGNLRPVIKIKPGVGIRDNGTNLELYDENTGKSIK